MSAAGTAGAAGRPLRADARRNYERVLVAAREVLRREGEAASLEEIARAAGVGIGTLYRHFPSRFDLIAAVYTDDVAALERSTRESEQQPAWDAVVAMVTAFAEFGLTKRALLAELPEGTASTDLLRCKDTIRGCARAVLERARAEGAVRDDVEPTDLLRLVSGLVVPPLPDPDQLRRLIGIVLAGIRA